jgi:hypothetical protein
MTAGRSACPQPGDRGPVRLPQFPRRGQRRVGRIGVGWNTMRDLVGVGDFNRDGHNDVIGVESATGLLYLYHGDGGALVRRVTVDTGCQNMRPLA